MVNSLVYEAIFKFLFFKKEKENYWTHSVHSLAAAELQSISNYSNTINHVLLRSRTELLSNYKHNHIWLLFMSALVTFQKKKCSLCVWETDFSVITRREISNAFQQRKTHAFIVRSLCIFPEYNHNFSCVFFLTVPTRCSLFAFLFIISSCVLWQQVFRESEGDKVPQLLPVIYSYAAQTHTGPFKNYQKLTPDVLFVALRSPQ